MTSVWLQCDSADLAVADRLRAELTGSGVTVMGAGLERPAAASDAVVVLLSAVSLPPESLRWAREWDDRVVPVSVDGAVHPDFGEANQIMLTTVGYAAAAAQIAAVAAAGGRTLTRLRELFASAQEWDQAGRHRNTLFGNRDQLDAARGLVAACPPEMYQDLAAEYVDASASHLRRRGRRLILGGVLVALILVTATLIALVQRSSSASAADQLNREARQETSKRLASLSRSLLDMDPDLPRIAATEAITQDRGPQAAAAAREVLIQSLGHRSLPLDILPIDVSVGGDVLAVVGVGGLTQVREVRSGKLLRSFDLDLEVDNVELSVDGAHLAMFGPEGFEVVSTLSGEQGLSGAATFGTWVGEVLLTVTNGVLEARALKLGGTVPDLPDTDGPVSSYAVSADLSLIAVIARDRVEVSSLNDGRAGWIGPAEGATDVEFAPTGELFIVGANEWHVVDEPMSAEATRAESRINGFPLVRPLTNSGLVALNSDGTFGLVYGFGHAYGTPTLLRELAHRGPAIGLATIPEGGFATVGGDRYVRLWEEPDLPTSVAGRAFAEAWTRVEPRHREGSRPSLALSADGSTIMVSQGVPAIVSRVDATSLTLRDDVGESMLNLGELEVRAHPCGDDGVFLAARGGGTSEILNLVTEGEDVLTQITNSFRGAVISAHLGCSSDGADRAWADSRYLRFYDSESDSWSSTPVVGDGAPISILAASTPLSIATRKGDRVSPNGIRSRLTPAGVDAVAAGDTPDRHFVAVGTDGRLYVSSPDSGPRQFGDVPEDLEAYAIRVSPDGQLAAVIGNLTTEIYDTKTGALFLALASGDSEFRKPVRDLLFVDDGLVTIDGVGSLARYTLPAVEKLGDELRPTPRVASPLERDLVLRIVP